jgi:hypothetical protein
LEKEKEMDDKLFKDMLNELDAMTGEEYWALYHDAQKLSDFPPPGVLDPVKVPQTKKPDRPAKTRKQVV